nr:butyrophilin-like protein 1 [Arvicanthis niloticus]
MKGSTAFPLASCLLPLLLLVSMGVSKEVSWFIVKGPSETITALLGTDAILPCQLFPEQSAARMHIRWYRAQLTPAVLVFHNRQEQGEVQMPEYRGRTQMVRHAIDTGSVALQIQKVQASEDGLYHCQFTDNLTSQEVSMELQVTGLGSAPLVHMTGLENDGIRVLSSSSGWFPKPKVQWRDTVGDTLLSSSESQVQDRDRLFHVEASLLVTDRAVGHVICSIQNPIYNQEKSKAILLPEPFFPTTCPWSLALACFLPILLLLLGGISLAAWKEHRVKRREMKKCSKEHDEILQMKKETKTALKVRDDLQADLDRRKALYREDWKKAFLYPDWRMELFQLAHVMINHEMPTQDKSDSKTEENRGKETADPSVSSSQGDHNIIMLSQEGFMLGRYYWEMDVEDMEEWTLGVYELYTQDASPTGSLRKFRVLEKKGDEYRALAFSSQNIFWKNLCHWRHIH